MRLVSCLRIVSLIAALLLQGTATLADDDGESGQEGRLEDMQKAVERGEIKSLATLRSIVAERFPGEIVRISTSGEHGRYHYEFRVLRPDGRLLEIEMDAASGEVLEVENDE